MKPFKIEFTFVVHDDDMPSERRLQYRQAILDAMDEYKNRVETDIKQNGRDSVDPERLKNSVLIDGMLNDFYR